MRLYQCEISIPFQKIENRFANFGVKITNSVLLEVFILKAKKKYSRIIPNSFFNFYSYLKTRFNVMYCRNSVKTGAIFMNDFYFGKRFVQWSHVKRVKILKDYVCNSF